MAVDVEIRHLEALVAVAATGTFGRAAEALGYTQSAVSQQIATLERAVGTPMFERLGGPRPVRLTPAGEVLVDHAQTLLADLRGALADVASITLGDRGRLQVGTIQSVGTKVLPRLLTRFRAERPAVEIVLHEAHDPQDLLAMVEDRQLDITFCDDESAGPFASALVLDDPYVVLAPATDAWRHRPSMSIDEVAAHPLIGNRNPTCSGLTALHFGDLEPNIVFQSDDNSTIQGCVAAGLGISLAPLLTIDTDDASTVVLPVDPPVQPRRLKVAWREDRRPSALLDAFVDATVAVCAEIAAEWAADGAA